jgi:5'-3' exonuclease
VRVHLVDGTYELFRAYYGAPTARSPSEIEVGATLGFARSLLALLAEPGVTHAAVAFDHVIESFRNDLFAGYKTSEGVPADLLAQFPLAERVTAALGVVVWPMVEFEADDAMATAACRYAEDPRIDQVVLCTPDKDMAQCVRGSRVVTFDRMRRKQYDERAVIEKFGVEPASIPDWLALVGDDADGIPGIPRWGARSAATLLARYRRIEAIPDDAASWDVQVRGAAALAASLSALRPEAGLYKQLATLRADVPLVEDLEALRWRGPCQADLEAFCRETGDPQLLERASRPPAGTT